MKVILTYHHDSNAVSVSFSLNANEEAFAIGFGKTCGEAEKNLKGWLNKESETLNKEYQCEEDKPFIALIKKTLDGKIVKTNSCINILKDFPPGAANQITTRPFYF